MELHVLFMQRTENYEGQHAPEALACIDEWSLNEDGKEWWAKEVAKQKALHEDSAGFAVVRVKIDQETIRSMCLDADRKVEGEVLPDPEKVELEAAVFAFDVVANAASLLSPLSTEDCVRCKKTGVVNYNSRARAIRPGLGTPSITVTFGDPRRGVPCPACRTEGYRRQRKKLVSA